MNDLIEAAVEVHEWLRDRDVPHVFIGGLAVQFWGEPRATADVDVSVAMSAEKEEQTIRQLLEHFRPRFSDAAEFALKNRILPVLASNGCGIDISLAGPWFEEAAITRAVEIQVPGHKTIPVCSADDLVAYKAIAARATDTQDVASIIERQGKRLDIGHIRRVLREFTVVTDDDEPTRNFEQAWKKYGPESKG